jgi:outer membrane protein TolC
MHNWVRIFTPVLGFTVGFAVGLAVWVFMVLPAQAKTSRQSQTLVSDNNQSGAKSAMNLNEFALAALNLDSEYQAAKADQISSAINFEAADSLWRGVFEAAPYKVVHLIEEPKVSPNAAITKRGVRWGYSQLTPWGTQFHLGIDKEFENNLEGEPVRELVQSFSLSQPLLQNSFGKGLRLQRSAARNEALAQSLAATLKERATCLRAANQFVQAWTLDVNYQFIREVSKMSQELLNAGAGAAKRGQIGKMDWLGLQADHLHLKSLDAQAAQALSTARLNIENSVPTAVDKTLEAPGELFTQLQEKVSALKGPASSMLENQIQATSQALEDQWQVEKNNALPNLDLKLGHETGKGKFGDDTYRDSELTVSLNLSWKLNDPSVKAGVEIARLESKKATLKLQETERTRQGNFRVTQLGLQTLAEQLKIESERAQILRKITDENRQRFVQGRIEFQDLLRIKEQWFESEQQIRQKQASYWASLLEFALQENVMVSFCGGSDESTH